MTDKKKIEFEELADEILEKVSKKNLPYFIALLDEKYSSWDVTVPLINHFEAWKEVFEDELPEKEWKFKPKKISVSCTIYEEK